jgi:hypothetical protein
MFYETIYAKITKTWPQGGEDSSKLKGIVSRDFIKFGFFYQTTPRRPLIYTLKSFRKRRRIISDIRR